MTEWREKEVAARRAIENRGFIVHSANVLFGENCPNIDLVVYARDRATYVQVKSSHRAAGKDRVIVDGSPWTEETLLEKQPLFNRHAHLRAALIMVVDHQKGDRIDYYLVPPPILEDLARRRGLEWYNKRKKDGEQRSIASRKRSSVRRSLDISMPG